MRKFVFAAFLLSLAILVSPVAFGQVRVQSFTTGVAQPIPPAYTGIIWANPEEYNLGGCIQWDSVGGKRFTILPGCGGLYHIYAQVRWDDNLPPAQPSELRYAYINLQTGTYDYPFAFDGLPELGLVNIAHHVNVWWPMCPGNWFSIVVNQNSGATRNLAGYGETYVTAERLDAAVTCPGGRNESEKSRPTWCYKDESGKTRKVEILDQTDDGYYTVVYPQSDHPKQQYKVPTDKLRLFSCK